MTVMMLATGAPPLTSPASATGAPWNSSTTPCVIPTPDGVGAAIHPSVVDMGSRWCGYRWWMVNTPYTNNDNDIENPCIFASNDRRTWFVPPGLTNPLAPNPGDPWFHSDTELVWDPDTRRLVMFYRRSATGVAVHLRAMSSLDGVKWTDHGTILELPPHGPRASPAIWRAGPGDWRMWVLVPSVA